MGYRGGERGDLESIDELSRGESNRYKYWLVNVAKVVDNMCIVV